LSPPFYTSICLILKRIANKLDDYAHTHAHTLVFGRKVRLHDRLDSSDFLRRQTPQIRIIPLVGWRVFHLKKS
ncbi:hypothetical protein, partial [Halothiobacillus sp. 15-55-196]|uniref:hypothetical protein n=1 Tax=Halothiobacillus sp. 15-55-196 TaxID=1970382 RepID=UPI0025BE1F81